MKHLQPQILKLPDSDILYFNNFLDLKDADYYFNKFLNDVAWQQDDIMVFGKTYAQPRLTALYASNNKPYSYSNLKLYPHKFSAALKDLKQRVEGYYEIDFTTCLLNLYRDGNDSNGWHSDNEKELGENPVIASVTLGHARFFHLRHKQDKKLKHKILLEHGSLLLMKGETQQHWQHQIAKTKKPIGQRINLTFRIIN